MRKIKCDPATLRAAYANREEDFWAWRGAAEKAGIDATLEALGLSTDRNHLWYNEHTGDVETLYSLIVDRGNSFGTDENKTEQEKVAEFAMALENWLPQIGDTNPVVARAAALSEADVLQQLAEYLRHHFQHTKTAEAFASDVCRGGATMPDGSYSGYIGGKVRVNLHDDRMLEFSCRTIYKFIKQREQQPTLF